MIGRRVCGKNSQFSQRMKDNDHVCIVIPRSNATRNPHELQDFVGGQVGVLDTIGIPPLRVWNDKD